MTAVFRVVLGLCGAIFFSAAALAQDLAASIVADRIRFDQNTNQIEADGNVEVFYDGVRLRAEAIVYDGTTDAISLTGPIVLTQADGTTVIFADSGSLTTDLQEGILSSARVVLNRRLQIAATEIDRVDGRYTQAYQAVASSCEVCEDNPVPLWEIRARRVVHDQLERQVYFDDATFRVVGVPVAYTPRLRLPDPTLERATGFLAPRVRLNDNIGTQLVIPYFFRLGDHRDLTVSPWIGTPETRTAEVRYREAFRTGRLTVNAAISDDDLGDNSPRGYLFAEGAFALPRDFRLTFTAETVTDRAYLSQYGFPDRDLLETGVRISRTERDTYFGARVSSFASLREGDDNETLPTQVIGSEIVHRFDPPAVGGIATVGLEAFGYYRLSNSDGPDGRDVARVTSSLDWRRDTVLPSGLRIAAQTALLADVYNTRQGAELTGTEARVSPFVGVELRFPLARAGAGGGSQLIEPIVQLAWSETRGGEVPVEDSRIVEFDEANLFQLDRLPGQDQREEGRRANVGLSYTRTDPLGWSLNVVGGAVLRDEDRGQFTTGSGLDGLVSDYLVATRLSATNTWDIFNRAIFDDTLAFTSNELFLTFKRPSFELETSYIWLEGDAAEGRPRDTSELALDTAYTLQDNWTAAVDYRYDFVADGPTRAGLDLSYQNECVDMTFSVARRFTNSDTVTSVTEFGFTVSLSGFGASEEGRSRARQCRG